MTDYQLSNEDHEALEKFTKFFLVKAAQIIVQSRLGEKKTTKSKPVYSGSEWVKDLVNNRVSVLDNDMQMLF
jgi:autophagy-related protein 13